MQFAGNPGPLIDSGFECDAELPLKLSQPELMKRPKEQEKDAHTESQKPGCLKPSRRDNKVQTRALFIPDAIVIGGCDSKMVCAGTKSRIKRFATSASILPFFV